MNSPSIQVSKDAYDEDKKFSQKITCPALELINIQDGNIGFHLQVRRGGTHLNGVGSEQGPDPRATLSRLQALRIVLRAASVEDAWHQGRHFALTRQQRHAYHDTQKDSEKKQKYHHHHTSTAASNNSRQTAATVFSRRTPHHQEQQEQEEMEEQEGQKEQEAQEEQEV